MESNKFFEYLKNKRIQMKECNHLFVKLSDENNINSPYNFPVVKCLKCGLTNRYIEMSPIEKRYNMYLGYYNPYYIGYVELNDEIFKKQIKEQGLNLISDEAFISKHPMKLYEIAKTIDKDADNTKIFDIMKKLEEIETPEERIELINMNELLERYNNIKEKSK